MRQAGSVRRSPDSLNCASTTGISSSGQERVIVARAYSSTSRLPVQSPVNRPGTSTRAATPAPAGHQRKLNRLTRPLSVSRPGSLR